jgi:hypothetical protein
VGGRLTGRVGRFSLGLLNIQTGDEPAVAARSTNFSVVRVKRDLLRRSSVGVLFTGRRDGEPGGDNAAYGADMTLAFFENLAINSYWARTATDGVSGQDTSYRGQLDYNGDRYGVQAEHLLVGEHFNPGVGYVRRHDMRKSFALLRFSPRARRLAGVVRRWWWLGSINYVENGAGRLETREQDGEFAIEFQNADRFSINYNRIYEFLPIPFGIASNVVLPIGGYGFDNLRVGFIRGAQRRFSGNLFAEYGTFYNGHKTTVGVATGRVNVTARFSMEPTYSIDRVDLLQGAFTNHLAGTRITFTPTPP